MTSVLEAKSSRRLDVPVLNPFFGLDESFNLAYTPQAPLECQNVLSACSMKNVRFDDKVAKL